MAAPVTVRTIAEQAAVSIGTVSRVLNNHGNVNAELRQRVLRVAAELGYERSARPARGLREIFFMFHPHDGQYSPAANPFWSHILAGVEGAARERGMHVSYRCLVDAWQPSDPLFDTLRASDSAGVLLVGPAPLELVKTFQQTLAPLVLVDHHVPRQEVDSVLGDNVNGAREAVEQLIAAGHRRIALIGGPTLYQPGPRNTIYTIEQRALGYRAALLGAGLAVDPDLYEAGTLEIEGGYAATTRLLDRGAPFTALFCANDHTAVGAIKALAERGLRVPADISVVGFDDIELAEHLTPALSTVRVDKETMGRVAVQCLLDRAADPARPHPSLALDLSFIPRGTIAPPR
ncbi:MAG TPA: LacI family DNA-binding transcriptional regulator [Roseiflexaceae bacterium]|nr:LacI family DNA-binding transcriptional regulator [Roseiflexaceae bacterium]